YTVSPTAYNYTSSLHDSLPIYKLHFSPCFDPLLSLSHTRSITGFGYFSLSNIIDDCRLTNVWNADNHCSNGTWINTFFLHSLKDLSSRFYDRRFYFL